MPPLGADHPDTLTSRNNLAAAYQAAGRTAEVVPLHERTLSDRERVLGTGHPNTLTTRNNLATAYRNAGGTTEATALFERTLADRERVLGADHPDTLTSRNNLATAYWHTGRVAEAAVTVSRGAHDLPVRLDEDRVRRPPKGLTGRRGAVVGGLVRAAPLPSPW